MTSNKSKSNSNIIQQIQKANLSMTVKYDSKIFPSCDYELYFDGCSKGNPGPAGIGAVLYKEKKEIWANFQYIGDNSTNNEAEYCALIMGLEYAIKLNIKILSVFGDSLLVIKQINGEFKVKNSKMIELHKRVLELKSKFDYIEFNHVYRNKNTRADELANLAIKMIHINDDVPLVTINKNFN